MTQTDPPSHAGPTVDGRLVEAFVAGVVDACGHFEARARRILADNGIDEVRLDESYPLGQYLDALREIQQTTGPNTLNRIGRAVPTRLEFPRDVSSMAAAYADLDRAYRRAHDGDGVGHFRFEQTEDGGVLTSETPYPDAFERGLIEGIGKRFGTGTGFVAIHDADRISTDGGDVREFDLGWWTDRSGRRTTTISPPRQRREETTSTGKRASA